MRVHITVEVPIEFGATEQQIEVLLRDALRNFVQNRTPVKDYVRDEYEEQSAAFKERKEFEVCQRLVWAEALRHSLKVVRPTDPLGQALNESDGTDNPQA